MLEEFTVLVPLDGSEESAGLLPYLKDLAAVWKAKLLLLRVVDPLSLASPAVDDLEHWGVAATRAAESFLLEKTRFLSGVKVETLCLRGAASQVICQVAERCHLIAFAPHGHSGLKRWVFGSVAEEVLRDSPCPVFLVRGQTNVPFRHLLLPVDASESSLEVCRRAEAFGPTDLNVTLLHCHGDQPLGDRWCKIFENLTGEKERWELVCRPGKAPRAIIDWLSESDCDLIAMASHGRKGLRRFFKGSVTEQVARVSPCPVLVFPTASLVSSGGEVASL